MDNQRSGNFLSGMEISFKNYKIYKPCFENLRILSQPINLDVNAQLPGTTHLFLFSNNGFIDFFWILLPAQGEFLFRNRAGKQNRGMVNKSHN